MKYILVFLICIGLTSCKKESTRLLDGLELGTWELEHFSGYPFTSQPLPPGNGQIIIIGADGIFERRQHDTVLFKGKYSLGKKKDCHPGNSDITFTTTESQTSDNTYIDIENGKLTLSSSNCLADGGTAFYLRIR